jgi:hypothetical protein
VNDIENADTTDTLCVAGGLALMVFGAGLLIARPGIRRIVQSGLTGLASRSDNPFSQGLSGMLPDVERYLKIKSM